MELWVIHDCTHVSSWRMVVTISWFHIHESFYSYGCDHTEDVCTWSLLFGWLRPYHRFMYYYMPIHVSLGMIIRDVIYVYVCVYDWFAGLLTVLFSSLHWLVKHLIHHSLFFLHALGGIYYTTFCHISYSFPLPYLEVPKHWIICIISIMIYRPKPQWRIKGNCLDSILEKIS